MHELLVIPFLVVIIIGCFTIARCVCKLIPKGSGGVHREPQVNVNAYAKEGESEFTVKYDHLSFSEEMELVRYVIDEAMHREPKKKITVEIKRWRS